MKNVETILEFIRYGKSVFIDDLTGWGDEANIPNFRFAEGENAIIACNGNKLPIKPYEVRRGNHLTVHLQENCETVEKIYLGDLFPNHDVVIATCGERLVAFTPLFNSKTELDEFMATVNNFCDVHQKSMYHKTQEEITKLASWFYYNTPQKDI